MSENLSQVNNCKLNIPGISGEEPVFILRIKDKLAAATFKMYRLLANSDGVKPANRLQKEIDACITSRV
jgi:hypothetical protein